MSFYVANHTPPLPTIHCPHCGKVIPPGTVMEIVYPPSPPSFAFALVIVGIVVVVIGAVLLLISR